MRALLFLAAVLAAGPLMARSGTLVIVGGGLSPDNAAVYRAFIDAAKDGKIAIIPSASGEPQASLDAFAANLKRHGVKPEKIVEVRLAEIDDPATPLDESGWAANGNNVEEIAKIESASAIWFTGGDQARTMRLLKKNSRSTPMLDAIWRRLSSGAVIGGTSAGAAIMGETMILCGDPARAMIDPVSFDPADCAPVEGGSEPLVLADGLGFLPRHVVDQHFSQRARLPRLVRAVACGPAPGLGIDEDTALVIDRARWSAKIVGKGGVTSVAGAKTINCELGLMPSVSVQRHQSGDGFRLGVRRRQR